MSDEKRVAPRKRVLKAGTIVFNNRSSTLSCTVRDLSDTGARLRVQKGHAVPSRFELRIEVDGFEVPCTVAWKKGEDVGVVFDAPPTKLAPSRAQVVGAVERPGGGSLLRRKT